VAPNLTWTVAPTCNRDHVYDGTAALSCRPELLILFFEKGKQALGHSVDPQAVDIHRSDHHLGLVSSREARSERRREWRRRRKTVRVIITSSGQSIRETAECAMPALLKRLRESNKRQSDKYRTHATSPPLCRTQIMVFLSSSPLARYCRWTRCS